MGVRIAVDRIEALLTLFFQMIGRETSSSSARILLLDRDGGIAFQRFWPHSVKSMELADQEIIQKAVEESRPFLVENGEKKRSLLCLPFYYQSRPAGALCLGRDPGLKPFSPDDLEFLILLSRSIHPVIDALICQNDRRQGHDREPSSAPDSGPIIGKSRAFRMIQLLIDKIKDTDAPVFISGESGTGKELVARAIHERGRRRGGPFVAVNCGAIPDQLLESEIFGYARGAFTGAWRDKAGLIEEAGGGTFFLDEIGDLSPPLQAKLLRLLQEKEIRRIGETRTRRVDVRFVSATNKNLEKEIEAGNFRVDLFYRLRILTIEVPPLRERKGDLLLLINHFVDKYCGEMNRERTHLSPRALELLLNYPWPGNIRELQNEIQRALILASGEELVKEEHLSSKINPQGETSVPAPYNFFEAKAEFEKRFLNQALRRFGSSKARTAAEIGMSRQGLFKLLKKHNIESTSGG